MSYEKFSIFLIEWKFLPLLHPTQNFSWHHHCNNRSTKTQDCLPFWNSTQDAAFQDPMPQFFHWVNIKNCLPNGKGTFASKKNHLLYKSMLFQIKGHNFGVFDYGRHSTALLYCIFLFMTSVLFYSKLRVNCRSKLFYWIRP